MLSYWTELLGYVCVFTVPRLCKVQVIYEYYVCI
jgi:hypothetical protein